MLINGKNHFMGAYEEIRQKSDLTLKVIDESLKSLVTSAAKAAITGMDQHQNGNVSVSISQENIDFLCSEAGYEKMRKDVEELYSAYLNKQKTIAAGNNNESPFWENTASQWMVFSEYLYNNGFFSGMEDKEVQESENLLRKITAGMDNIGAIQYGTGNVIETGYAEFYGQADAFMSSSEVRLELEASTSALKYFADKYIDDDKKEQFNKLIDQYNKHNSEVMEGYHSIHESFARAIHDIHSGKYPGSSERKPAEKPYDGFQYFVYMGGIRHTDQENKQFQLNMHDLFENIRNNTDKWDLLWNQLKENYTNFITNNADDEGLKNYAFNQSESTFKRISNYWSELLG